MRAIGDGAEPFLLPGGPVGCLLVHGFTASPQEMRGLGEHLAGRGLTALGVRLFAHGTRLEDMLRARWQDWHGAVEDGYHVLRGRCPHVVVVGLSLGGALGLILAASREVAGVAALATPYSMDHDPRYRWLPLLARLIRFKPKGPSDFKDPQAAAARVAYDAYPLRAFLEVDRTLRAMRACLPAVQAPALLMHSRQDTFVPPSSMTAIHDRLGSADRTTRLVSDSNHVITCDRARLEVFEAVAGFAARVAGPAP